MVVKADVNIVNQGGSIHELQNLTYTMAGTYCRYRYDDSDLSRLFYSAAYRAEKQFRAGAVAQGRLSAEVGSGGMDR